MVSRETRSYKNPIRTIGDAAIGDFEGRRWFRRRWARRVRRRESSEKRSARRTLTVLKHTAGTMARQNRMFREGDPNHGHEPDTRQAERPRRLVPSGADRRRPGTPQTGAHVPLQPP